MAVAAEPNISGIGGQWVTGGIDFDTKGIKEFTKEVEKAAKAVNLITMPFTDANQLRKVDQYFDRIITKAKAAAVQVGKVNVGVSGSGSTGLGSQAGDAFSLYQRSKGTFSQQQPSAQGVPSGVGPNDARSVQGLYAQPGQTIWEKMRNGANGAGFVSSMRGGLLRTAVGAAAWDVTAQRMLSTGAPVDLAGRSLAGLTATPGRFGGFIQQGVGTPGWQGTNDLASAMMNLQSGYAAVPGSSQYNRILGQAGLIAQGSRGTMNLSSGAAAVNQFTNPQFVNLMRALPGGFDPRNANIQQIAQQFARLGGINLTGGSASSRLAQMPNTMYQGSPFMLSLERSGLGSEGQNAVIQQIQRDLQLGTGYTGSAAQRKQLGIGQSQEEIMQKFTRELDTAKTEMAQGLTPLLKGINDVAKPVLHLFQEFPGASKALGEVIGALAILKTASLAAAAAENLFSRSKGAGAAGEAAAVGGIGLASVAKVAGQAAVVYGAYSSAKDVIAPKKYTGYFSSDWLTRDIGGALHSAGVKSVGGAKTTGDPWVPTVGSPTASTASVAMPSIGNKPVGDGPLPGPGHTSGMKQTLLDKLLPMFKDNPALTLTSGYRSLQEQQALYSAYVSGHGNLAAKPGSSMHEFGLAADIDDKQGGKWITQNAKKYGLVQAVGGEWWHLEPPGARGLVGSPNAETGEPPPGTAAAKAAADPMSRLIDEGTFAQAGYGQIDILRGIMQAINSSAGGGIGGAGQSNGAGPPTAVSAAGSNAMTADVFLRQHGLSRAGAAGVVGNLEAESGVNPNSLNSIGAYGIAQWLGGRKTNLYAYAKQNNKPANDLGIQLNFLWSELSGQYGGLLGYLKTTNDPVAAADQWEKQYERSGGALMAQRENNAKTIYAQTGDPMVRRGKSPVGDSPVAANRGTAHPITIGGGPTISSSHRHFHIGNINIPVTLQAAHTPEEVKTLTELIKREFENEVALATLESE